MLKREIKITADGSPTLYIPEWDEAYHSKHGALQEALHVFIKNGYHRIKHDNGINILEFGFGTGLNALLTQIIAEAEQRRVNYHSIEKFPLSVEEIKSIPIPSQMASALRLEEHDVEKDFQIMHQSKWNTETILSKFYHLKKIEGDFKTISLPQEKYDLIYFDAFGKRVQPELWTVDIFEKAYKALKKDGLLTTYACNGSTKRALKQIGFIIEKLAGPPGKREMINAWKI